MNTEVQDQETKIVDENTDFEVGSLNTTTEDSHDELKPFHAFIKYLLAGILFGIILVKSEVISWFRIQEMFRLQSFHMYGVIGSAVVTGIIAVAIIKRFKLKTFEGDSIQLPVRPYSTGQIIGGTLFGFGWALTGACPGPLYAQIGAGSTVTTVTILSAIFGTWVYANIKRSLPH
ncbi:MAG: DUF6691 family protein [Saprospiraceae bacterium]